MDLNQFDKQLKSKLEQLEAPSFEGSSWSALENKLNAAVSEEQPAPVEPVDLATKRVLEKLESPYQSAHWSRLSTQLDRYRMVRKLRQYKLAEAAIFLLLLINVEGFLGGFGAVIEKYSPELEAPKDGVPMAGSPSSKTKKRIIHSINNPGAIGLNNHAAENGLVAPVSVLDQKTFYATSGIVRFDALPGLPAIQPVLMASTQSPSLPAPMAIDPIRASAGGMYLAIGGLLDHFQASEPGYRNSGAGAGIAMTVGYRKGKWGIETGIETRQVAYEPKKETTFYAGSPIDGFLGATTTQVDADLVTVPLRVTRQFAKIGRGTLQGSAGVSASVAAAKRFQQKSSYFPPASQSGGNQPDPSQFPIPNKKNDGILEGGRFASNAFLSAELGIRVEHPVGKRHIAFIAPTYRHAVAGSFGPRKEKFHALSIQAGVMATL